MPIYKRPDSETYSYDFRVKGVRYSGNTGETTKRKAEEVERKERDRAKSEVKPAGQPMTVGEGIGRYFTEVGEHHVNSDTTLAVFLWLERELGKRTLLAKLSDADIARIITKKRSQAIDPKANVKRYPTPATINRHVVQPLRALLARARKTWKVEVQDIHWTDHLLKEPEERVRELMADEEIRLFASLRPDYYPIVKFALITGCRLQECLDLQWRQIDWSNRQMRITGKGSKTRTVPISKACYKLLTEVRANFGSIPATDTQVFTYQSKRADNAPRGERVPIAREGLKITFKRAVAKAGITDFTFHDLRHTRATRLLRTSGNLRLVKDLLGHSDIETTLKYAHVTQSDLLNAMNATENATEVVVAVDKQLKDNEI